MLSLLLDVWNTQSLVLLLGSFQRCVEATIHIAKQCKTESCHKPSFSKEGLGGL